MNLARKISDIEIGDVYNYNFFHGVDYDGKLNPYTSNRDAPLLGATLGCNFATDKKSELVKGNDSKIGSRVIFSPIIYYLSPERQKLLIIHELVHCKIGNAHGHDSYFWYMVEKYSNIDRKYDISYSKKEEQENNESWNYWIGKGKETVNNLIQKDMNSEKYKIR